MAENPYFLIIAGMLFARGTLINPRENCIVLYFFDNEKKFLKDLTKNIYFFDPITRKVAIKNNHESEKEFVNCLFILAKFGLLIKENLNIHKFNLIDRMLTTKILNLNNDDTANFLSGIFSMNGNIEKKGWIFNKHSEISLKDSGIRFLMDIKNMLEKLGIQSNIILTKHIL